MIEILNSLEDDAKQPSIMVPMGDLDTVEHDPNAVDELAMELATIKQPAKRIAIIGSRYEGSYRKQRRTCNQRPYRKRYRRYARCS